MVLGQLGLVLGWKGNLKCGMERQSEVCFGCFVSQEFMDVHSELLAVVDPSIIVEAAWFVHMVDTGCADLLHEAVLSDIPSSAATYRQPKDVASKLEMIQQRAIYTFADDESQSRVNIVLGWVRAIINSRAPCFKAVTGEGFLAKAKDQLPWLLRVERSSGSSGQNNLHGREALAQLWDDIQEKLSKDGIISFADLKVFDTFHWLLDAEQKKQHKAIIAKLLKDAGSKSVAVKSSTADEAPASKKAKTEALAAKASKESTMNLFKKKMIG